MLGFSFSEEQDIFRRSVREYLEKNLAPASKEMFKNRRISPEIWRALAEFGLTGLKIPEEYGGSGADWVTTLVAIEELSKVDVGGMTIIPVLLNNTEGHEVVLHGSDRLKEELLRDVASGRAALGIGSTEPGCGTDFSAAATRIRKEGSEYVINGEKQCVSQVYECQEFGGGHLVTGKTNPELGHRGMSQIYVPIGAEGVETTEFETVGLPLGSVKYNNVRVPDYYLLGEENKGIYYTLDGFVVTRMPITMALVGSTRTLLEQGMEYIKERKAFGRPIAKFEAIQFALAEHHARLQAARWLTYRAAWMRDMMEKEDKFNSHEVSLATSEAKLLASIDCVKACLDILSWYGALGTTTEFDAHMVLMNMIGLNIGEGTVEAQKLVIGSELLGREFAPYR